MIYKIITILFTVSVISFAQGTDISDYLKKIEAVRGENTVYSEEYRIHNIDNQRRDELRQALMDKIGFIV